MIVKLKPALEFLLWGVIYKDKTTVLYIFRGYLVKFLRRQKTQPTWPLWLGIVFCSLPLEGLNGKCLQDAIHKTRIMLKLGAYIEFFKCTYTLRTP